MLKKGILTVLILLFTLGGIYFLNYPDPEKRLKKEASRLGTTIDQLWNDFQTVSKDSAIVHSILFPEKNASAVDRIAGKPYEIIIYNNDSLLFWSSNQAIPHTDPGQFTPGIQLARLKNGYYLIFRADDVILGKSLLTVAGLLPLKYEYSIQNEYLPRGFNPTLKVPSFIALSDGDHVDAIPVRAGNGDILFHIAIDQQKLQSKPNYPAFILQIAALILLLYYLHILGYEAAQRYDSTLSFLVLTCIVFAVRALTHMIDFPFGKENIPLFNPHFYATSEINDSLGSLLINAGIITWLVLFFFKNVRLHPPALLQNRFKGLTTGFMLFILVLIPGLIVKLLQSLVLDSQISYDVTNILSLNRFSLFGFICLCLIILSYVVFALKLIRLIVNQLAPSRKVFLIALVSALIAGLVFFNLLYAIVLNNPFYSGAQAIVTELTLPVTLWSGVFIALLYYLVRASVPVDSFASLLALLVTLSIFTTMVLFAFNTFKEHETRKLFARKLSSQREPITEILFAEKQEKILNDKVIQRYFINPYIPYDEIADRLKYHYFGGYFTKYDIQIYTLDKDGKVLKGGNALLLSYLEKEVSENAQQTSSEYLFFISRPSGNYSYIASLPILYNHKFVGTLIIEMTPKVFTNTNVYPELLLESRIHPPEEFEKYDYAVYMNGVLVNQRGLLIENKIPPQAKTTGTYTFFTRDGYSILLYRPSDEIRVFVSVRYAPLVARLSLFSYMFCIFLLFLLSIKVILALRKFHFNFHWIGWWNRLAMRKKIQYMMLLIIILPFISIGSVTIKYLKRQYEDYHKERLMRKEKAVLSSLEYLLKNEQDLILPGNRNKILRNKLTGQIGALSDIHSIDINIYALNGKLLLSSQPGIFEKGLISDLMDARAYELLARARMPHVMQNESIGNLKYLSAYIPVRNAIAEPVAFLNIPYFAKEKNLRQEISAFLVTLINVYVLLLVIGGTLTLLLGNSITRSLSVIGEKLGRIRLGAANEPIEWGGDDEIGLLVSEYNKMIKELERSAQLLAKSERESAWREMAKQVAHEIKNPLTPMKLSIQHLQRVMQDKKPGTEEMVERVTRTLIEQIDNLAQIATEFSNFAKMPKPTREKIDLRDVITAASTLFQEKENAHIEWQPPQQPAMVFADKNQLLRAFNNLIKNAIQAIPDEREGMIRITLDRVNGYYRVAVEDNGIGISEEQRKSVFVPNFTTKSSGTGLGLAITRQIVENSGGKIYFESKVGEGTTFYVELPVAKDDDSGDE